ncbi:hypothetical protein MPSEU_000560500 [Mayamaea pseudoterrestris]|nr:hypothetical protein MPSEU_000560500 [Mayamaea pseudoterrestris]
MVKRKQRSKRSVSSLPKGLPTRGGGENPFEAVHRAKRPKHDVVNRPTMKSAGPSALARSIQQRQEAIQAARKASQSANVFQDKRIGEYSPEHSQDDKQIARLVRERSQRSKRSQKFNLDGDNEELLTHKGKTLDKLTAADHIILSDDEDDDFGGLETDLHFGGGTQKASIYGHSVDMADVYAQRKNDLDDIIMRRKILKAERLENKHMQEEKIETMDEQYQELANLLQFRDKEKEIREYTASRRNGTLTKEDEEFEEWNKELKTFQFASTKVKAADRTKTPEEVAKEEADRLQELETRRLARMNGDFDSDSLADISDEEGFSSKVTMSKKRRKADSAEALDYADSDDDKGDQPKPRFTPDGLVMVNRKGVVVENAEEEDGDDELLDGNANAPMPEHAAGTRILANYQAHAQFDEHESWFEGVVTNVNKDVESGKVSYDITYDDGDFEEGVLARHVRLPSEAAVVNVNQPCETDKTAKAKLSKAKSRARATIPYVFEVPTTLDALHELIAAHASTGEDASTIIDRIYKVNSVRLDRRNTERMQNFYDVLLRRFVAIGDAIFESGGGGPQLGRYKQLNALLKALYAMAQDAPDSATAVWSRRLGVLQSAHAKRLRDAELDTQDEDNDEEITAWPSTGVFLALRSIGHIFPVTDRRHHVVTPTLLFLAQIIGHTPVTSLYDLVLGVMCSGLLLEYSKGAQRIVPECLVFLADVIRLYTPDVTTSAGAFALPSLGAASTMHIFTSLRLAVSKLEASDYLRLSLEKSRINGEEIKSAILASALQLTEMAANFFGVPQSSVTQESFVVLAESVLSLEPKSRQYPFPKVMQQKVRDCVSAISKVCPGGLRAPLRLRSGPTIREKAIKSLAPRMEDPSKYSLSKDKGKGATQAALDRTRREYKREHKAVARELRTDAAFFEAERRKDKEKKDSSARAKRHKAFSWMEGEQATMNQQVRQGGGLLSGGGIGAARAKAKSAKVGMKKGGKL